MLLHENTPPDGSPITVRPGYVNPSPENSLFRIAGALERIVNVLERKNAQVKEREDVEG